MKIIIKGVISLFVVTLMALMGGCSNTRVGIAGSAVSVDAATTFAGISGGAVEANPIVRAFGSSPSAAAGGSIVLSYAFLKSIKQLPVTDCINAYRAFTSVKFGATANNVAVIAGASGNIPVAVGVAVAVASARMTGVASAELFCTSHGKS